MPSPGGMSDNTAFRGAQIPVDRGSCGRASVSRSRCLTKRVDGPRFAVPSSSPNDSQDACHPARRRRSARKPGARRDRPPRAYSDGILIRNAYAGMIYADAEARRGTYYRETTCPWFPGREAAGVVEAVGRRRARHRARGRVAALVLAGGCYAEYVLARTAPQTGSGGRTVPAFGCRQAAARRELHAGARLSRQFPARASARPRLGSAQGATRGSSFMALQVAWDR